MPTPSSVPGRYPRNELKLEKTSLLTLRVKFRHLRWDSGTFSFMKHSHYGTTPTAARDRALDLKQEGGRFHNF